ncbi:TetR/AcrR family transcriptional regulator C-terminal domain-containing protein [Nonomuraea sp. NPDC050790]|uniref:TetR/AcrR family transcriptional regulator C-terminal domain-containing protein n=1 Tax=Nonomuraea sp. NPDC050790 TaxID=3364371 RepID=UPI0037BA4D61
MRCDEMVACARCGKELELPGRGRRPLYCSRSCQARAYRARRSARTVVAPVRGPRGETALSREAIVRTAVRIADAGGLERLSMRHVANLLGVKVMSLYTYLAGKDELIDLMVETVFAEGLDAGAEATGGWRAELEAAARWEWELYALHPWLLEVIATVRPPLVPSLLARFERGLGAFDGLGLDPVLTHRLYLGVSGLVQGLALLRVSEIASGRRGEATSLGHWRAVTVPAVYEELGAERYPRQSALRDSPDVLADLEEIFTVNLQVMLDGLAAFVDTR